MNKWDSLFHNGVVFPPEYEYQSYEIEVQGKKIVLPKEAEEVAVMWAQKLATPYVEDKTFQKNYWKDFKTYLPKDLQATSFPEDWDMMPIYSALQKKKEEKKNLTKVQRDEEAKRKAEQKEKYGWATINGQKVALANYIVEPPGLFMGRGSHPLRGRVKVRVYPEHVTLNLSKNAPPPPAPDKHSWMRVIENKNALWTAMWIDQLTGKQKRVLFSPASFVRQGADQKKFSKAITLAKNFDKVNEFIEKKMKSQDVLTRELATACNIIAKLTIRVGDEKDENEADTVGCTTLRYENIKILDKKVEFDFLGKDSVRYHNIVEFDDVMIKNLQELLAGKKKGDQIFQHISSHDVNEFLSIIIPGLSAKQFRTATGSNLLAEELRQKDVADMKEIKKVESFNEANLAVALKLNHQSAVSEAYDKSLSSMKSTLAEMKKELKSLKSQNDDLVEAEKKIRDERISYAKAKYKGDRQKESIRRAKETYAKNTEKMQSRIERLKDRVDTMTTKIAIKEQSKGVAMGTSKTNYSDPRIGMSWCKKNDVPLERIYTKTLLEKFSWAQDIDEDFYLNYPDVE